MQRLALALIREPVVQMASFAEEIAPADVKARAEATLLECGYKRSFSFGLWWAFEVKREYAPQPRRRRRPSLPSEACRR